MALLEELSGCKLLYRFRSSSHRIFRLNNISKALSFLDDRHVKLLGIDASGIADGTPSVVLNLVWSIILHFQIKEVTGVLRRHLSSSLSSLSGSSYPSGGDLSPQPDVTGSYDCSTLPSKGRKAAREPKYHGKAIKTLLQWVQRCTSKYGVNVRDFGRSWRSGLAFLAIIKSISPDLVDLRESLCREPKENIQQAFMIAHHSLDIPPLLEPEDVICTSPDEQSIITYVSMFLGLLSGTDEDHTTDFQVPEIPNLGSLESVSFGETLADDPEAKALLKGLERSSEQLLWKRWSRRSSGSARATSPHTNRAATSDLSSNRCDQSITVQPAGSAASSPFNKQKGQGRSVLQPPSPLEAVVVSQEIQSWMEKGLDQSFGMHGADESHFSLSSDEGIYSLSVLDSDEEDAYSYILDLNKEVFQPFSQLKRQVPKVEEETAEEMNEESRHQEANEMFNGGGCKHQEGDAVQNGDIDLESAVGAQSGVHRKFDLDNTDSCTRENTKNTALFYSEPESRTKEEREEESVFEWQSNDDYHEEEREKYTERVRLEKDGDDKREDDAVKAKIFEAASWQKDVKKGGERKLSETWGQVSEQDEGEDLTRFKEGQDLGIASEELGVKEEERGNQQSANLEGFTGGTNTKILIDGGAFEARRRVDTEEESDKRDNAVKLDSTKSKDGEKMEDTDEEINSTDFVPVKTADGRNGGLEIRRQKDLTATPDHPSETPTKHDTSGHVENYDGDNHWTPACSGTSQTFSERGSILQSLATSCDITPSELEMIFVLWILFYCCLILPQMNL
ncbi:uncharacterized protein clmnb [Embiotoca jacksoni]|uniref:uncharacterized protein clmnb n=1 Tax=Embiotoca jacksoni TaxID=100190 RepID=UPI0037049570